LGTSYSPDTIGIPSQFDKKDIAPAQSRQIRTHRRITKFPFLKLTVAFSSFAPLSLEVTSY
jgi:hypothetical protein